MVFELEDSSWIQRMGNNVTTNIKTALSLEPKGKKDHKTEKPRIGILSFEVANAMSKAVQLWQSLGDQEVHRLRTEVLKSEAITYLVSDDDNYLLGLACAEKLEDLNHVATAVSRLGKKCQEPALQGFEHVYNDLLRGNIDARALEFLIKDMDKKIKKMEGYIAATANLYQELEVLTDLEQSARKMQMNLHRQSNGNCSNGNNICNGQRDCGVGGAYYQRKIVWQRQEIKHLRDVSLWNTTYEKVVGLLARTVCTIYCRICSVFGSQALASNSVSLPPQFYDDDDDDEDDDDDDVGNRYPFMSGPLEQHGRSPMSMSREGMGHCTTREIRFASGPLEMSPVEANWGRRSGPILSRTGSRKGFQQKDLGSGPNGEAQTSVSGSREAQISMFGSRGSSPGRLFKECLNLNAHHPPKRRSLYVEGAVASKPCNIESRYCDTATTSASTSTSGHRGPVSQTEGLPASGPIRYLHSGPIYKKSPNTRTQFGSKCKKLIHAPPSTLGGSALALHYANVIILIEKLVRSPHLIGHDARDDLYQMLPTSVRVALRSRLKSYAKNLASTVYDAPLAADWKDALERILGWLAPLAHNMLKWQSEHNFEQQQVVSRTNVLLLQTLYYADQLKTESTITELLVGLNYICRYEQEVRASGLMDCSSQEFDEYLEWHCST